MSSSDSPLPAPPSWRSLLTGRWAISWRAWVLIALLMQWPYYARNSVLLGVPTAWVVAIGIVRALAAGLVLLVAHRTYLRRRSSEPAALWAVVATWFAAGLAAVAIQWAVFRYLDRPGFPPMRWLAAPLAMVLRSAVCAYYFGLRDYWKQSVRELQSSAQRLSALRASSRAELEDVRARVRTIVVQQVLPSVRRLQMDLGDESSPLTRDRLMRLSQIAEGYSHGVVRDASHRVSDLAAGAAHTPAVASEVAGQAPRREPRRPLLISIRWTALVFGVTLLPFAFTAPPDDPPLPILVDITVLLGILVLGAWIQARAGRWSRTTPWSVCWMAGMAVVGIGGLAAAGLIPERLATPVPLASLAVIVFLFAMLGSSMDRHLRGIAEQADALERVVEEISGINDALQEELAAEKRRVAHLLHGPVQGRLAAVAMLLTLEAGQDGTGDDIPQARERCRSILDQVMIDLTRVRDGTFDDGQPLPDRLAQLSERWAGLAVVSVEGDPEVYRAASSDAGLSMWVFDIVEEGINNAVTHGHAARIDVELMAHDATIEVSVRDDGTGCGVEVSPSLGLSTIGRSPAQLALEGSPAGGSRLTVTIPLSS